MATLFNRQTNEQIILCVNHTFGRDIRTNITALQSASASRNHAAIFWDGEKWQLKDFSKNGTLIKPDSRSSDSYFLLQKGAKIQFGHQPAETWEVMDLTPPITCLLPLHASLPLIPLYDVEILSVDGKDIMVYLADDGHWHCDIGGEDSVLKSGNTIGHNKSLWQFVDSRPDDATAVLDLSPPPKDVQFNFVANCNEHHVSLKLIINKSSIDLGERNHHYLLLLMARRRLSDQKNGLSPVDQGWLKKDELVKMLGMPEQHINIQIYRFRKQVATTLPNSIALHQIIERRPGELRFAYDQIHIKGGFQQLEKVFTQTEHESQG